MITLSFYSLAAGILAFILLFKIKIRKRLVISASIAIAPPLIVLSILLISGDKAPKDTALLYQGPSAIEMYKDKDDIYLKYINIGKENEEKGNYDKALSYYYSALNTDRVAMPSYYVLYDIGRTKYKMGLYDDAINVLNEFISKVEIEMNPKNDYAPFIIMEKNISHINNLKNIANNANKLIMEINANSKGALKFK